MRVFNWRERGQKTSVSSFGLRWKDRSGYRDLRNQVEVLYLRRDDESGQPTEFALDLCRHSKPNQIVLACIPQRETLRASLDDLEAKMARARRRQDERRFGANSRLLVPSLNWSIAHHFAELEGKDKRLLNAKFRDLYVATALQTIDFRLDRSGVELKSASRMEMKSADPHFCFDRPFLIVVGKRGAAGPFFVMRVANAEVLCKP